MLQIFPYRSRRLFQTDGKAGGINEEKTWTVKTEAIGKSQWLESPYLLANEWIAANIARFLRLPVPPFSIAGKRSQSTRMFISYSYDGDTTPDDVIPDKLYEKHSLAATGVVVFDILIANSDRHGANLKVDKPNNPSTFYLIDHERALFYIYKGEGKKRLASRIDRLGVTDGADSNQEWHCLVELVDSIDHLGHWVERVKSIPDWFLDEVCDEVWKISLTKGECDAVKEFLKRRRDDIGPLILAHRDRFPLISEWPLFL